MALRRAAHQVLDNPKVFDDPLALRIVRDQTGDGRPATLRAFVVARSRYAEDELATSVRAGTTQYVVLGPGLDTFAYRNPYPNLSVFEIDHPATQEWKRNQLKTTEYVPVDFERRTLGEALKQTLFDTH